MTANPTSFSQSFRELSAQARTLLFIYASAAWARYNANIPEPSVLFSEIEKVWSSEKLSAAAVSDPDRMTCLLEKHFESMRSEPVRRVATRTWRSRVSE